MNILREALSHWQMIGIGFFIFMSIFHSKMMKVNFNVVASFSTFLLILAAIRFGVLEGNEFNPNGSSFLSILKVFIEDAFFVAIPWWVLEKTKNKTKTIHVILKGTYVLLSCAFFAYGHIRFGSAFAILAFFLPMVSLHYARKYGFGTTMICHILYDFTTILTVKLMYLINLMRYL